MKSILFQSLTQLTEGELLHIQLRSFTALFDRAELDGGPGGFPVYGKVVLIMEGSLFRWEGGCYQGEKEEGKFHYLS